MRAVTVQSLINYDRLRTNKALGFRKSENNKNKIKKSRTTFVAIWDICIGVVAQSTLGGTTFLPEKYVWKINKMPEFYMILARKIITIPEFLLYLPKN